jgi:chromosome segregation and condensation protein ScpB
MSNPDIPGMALASSLQQVVGALIFGSERPLSIEEIRACLQEVGTLDEQTRVFADAAPREVRDAVDGKPRAVLAGVSRGGQHYRRRRLALEARAYVGNRPLTGRDAPGVKDQNWK